MQRVFKTIFYILLTFFHIKSFAQPGPTRHYFEGSFVLKEIFVKKNISFITKDSIHFISKKNNIFFSVYDIAYYLDKNTWKENNVFEKKKFKINNINYTYRYNFEENIFYISNLTTVSCNGLSFTKTITVFHIEMNKEEMLIYFDFSNHERYIDLGNFEIILKKGTFKVIDPDNPKLITIKKDE